MKGAPEFDLSDLSAAAFCPSCGAGYRAGPSRCADCDETLVPRSSVEAKPSAQSEPFFFASMADDEHVLEESSTQSPELDLADPDAAAFCPSCGSGYRAEISRCVDCGESLLPRSWVEARLQEESSTPEASTSTVALDEVTNPFKADLLAATLRESGIWFLTQPVKGWGGVRFLVRPEDHGIAQQALRELEDSDAASPGTEPSER